MHAMKRASQERGQAAIEYLMTYGWAILIIAIVLASLYGLSVFGGITPQATCTPSGGFLCQSPVLLTSGTLSINLGQSILPVIYNVGLACAASAQGSKSLPNPGTAFMYVPSSGGTAYVTYNSATPSNQLALPTGRTATVSGLTCYDSTAVALSTLPIGTPFTGYLWINYTSTSAAEDPSANSWITLQLATVNVRVS